MSRAVSKPRRSPSVGREAVLEAAGKNMARFGYHGTSVRDIAADANLSVAAIYYHFSSKQQILQDIMIHVLSDSIALTRSAVIDAGSDSRHRLRAFMRTWVMIHATRPIEATIGNSELRSLDVAGREIIVSLRDEQEQILADLVADGVASGCFRTSVSRDAVRAALNMGSAVASWYNPRGPLSPEELGDNYATIAMSMFESEPHPAPVLTAPPAPAELRQDGHPLDV